MIWAGISHLYTLVDHPDHVPFESVETGERQVRDFGQSGLCSFPCVTFSPPKLMASYAAEGKKQVFVPNGIPEDLKCPRTQLSTWLRKQVCGRFLPEGMVCSWEQMEIAKRVLRNWAGVLLLLFIALTVSACAWQGLGRELWSF